MLESTVRAPLHDEGLEALDEKAITVGKLLHEAGRRAHGRSGVRIAVAPPSAPLLDLRLLDVGLGEGGIELQRLVETLLGLLRALPAPTGELVESLQVEPLGFHRSGRELRGTPARSGDQGRNWRGRNDRRILHYQTER